MTVLYCTAENLEDYVLAAYLDKAEEVNPGIVGRTIAAVSSEILEAVAQGGHAVPDGQDSALLRRICAVISSYRTIGDITTLMDTEASSGNEWLPLQKLFDGAVKDLGLVRNGKLDPYPDIDTEDTSLGDTGISVSAPPAMFGHDRWKGF